MATIKLDPLAMSTANANLSKAASSFDGAQFNCFFRYKQLTSHSEAMSAFQQRVSEFKQLLDEYQILLNRDIAALEKACAALQIQDSHMGTHFQGTGWKSATASGSGSNAKGGKTR